MGNSLQDKIALVTGGSTGIGLGIASASCPKGLRWSSPAVAKPSWMRPRRRSAPARPASARMSGKCPTLTRCSNRSKASSDASTCFRHHGGHGGPMRRASEMSQVKGITTLGPHNMAAVSRKDWEASKAYGTHVVPLRKVRAQGAVASLAHIPDGERVYVSIDIDSFDPSIAPGTATISHGGFTYYEANIRTSYAKSRSGLR